MTHWVILTTAAHRQAEALDDNAFGAALKTALGAGEIDELGTVNLGATEKEDTFSNAREVIRGGSCHGIVVASEGPERDPYHLKQLNAMVLAERDTTVPILRLHDDSTPENPIFESLQGFAGDKAIWNRAQTPAPAV